MNRRGSDGVDDEDDDDNDNNTHTRIRTHRQKLVWLVGVGSGKEWKRKGRKVGGLDLRTRDEER